MSLKAPRAVAHREVILMKTLGVALVEDRLRLIFQVHKELQPILLLSKLLATKN